MKEIKIGNRTISDKDPVFFIGEIGLNHNGSLGIAKQLIDLAATLGADAVKFQKRTPEMCVPENKKNGIRKTPWGDMTYLEYRKRIEFGEKEYVEIDKYCKEKNIIWFASAWDTLSFEFLEKLNVVAHKVASPKLTDRELLEKIKSTKKPVFLSTGATELSKIKKAVELLEDTNPMVIMHCNSSYPSKDDELNLNVIKTLKENFPKHIIGYSGHETGISSSVVAATIGAKVIERHITLDRAMWGSDHAASVEFSGLRRVIRDIKLIDGWLGDGIKRVYESEKEIIEKLRNKDTL